MSEAKTHRYSRWVTEFDGGKASGAFQQYADDPDGPWFGGPPSSRDWCICGHRRNRHDEEGFESCMAEACGCVSFCRDSQRPIEQTHPHEHVYRCQDCGEIGSEYQEGYADGYKAGKGHQRPTEHCDTHRTVFEAGGFCPECQPIEDAGVSSASPDLDREKFHACLRCGWRGRKYDSQLETRRTGMAIEDKRCPECGQPVWEETVGITRAADDAGAGLPIRPCAVAGTHAAHPYGVITDEWWCPGEAAPGPGDAWPWCAPCNSYHAPGAESCRAGHDVGTPEPFRALDNWTHDALRKATAEREDAIRYKLIELGWTPPGEVVSATTELTPLGYKTVEVVMGAVVTALERHRNDATWEARDGEALAIGRKLWDDVHNAVAAANADVHTTQEVRDA